MCPVHNGKTKAFIVARGFSAICPFDKDTTDRRTIPAVNKDIIMARAISARHLEFNPVKRVQEIIQSFKTARARRALFNKSYAKLQDMSESELQEFGLHRTDLPQLARDAIK